MVDAPVLKLENIEKFYGQKIKTQILKSIDLTIERGSFSSIIGQSGSGKSTLLNIIGTLLTPDHGDVIINGINTKKMSKNQLSLLRARDIGFVFQNHLLLPEFTALENVLIPHQILYGKVDRSAKKQAEALMELVGLEKVKKNMAMDMSGGQQQRTAIARALMNNPSIILADEPTGNLDSVTTELIYEMMKKINQELKTTFIIVTHDRRVAEITERIIEIKDGMIVSDVYNR